MSYWYISRSRVLTNKKEAQRIAEQLRLQGNFKSVTVQPRKIAANKNAGTPAQSGYWIRVEGNKREGEIFRVMKVKAPKAPPGFGFKYSKFVRGNRSAPDAQFVFKKKGE